MLALIFTLLQLSVRSPAGPPAAQHIAVTGIAAAVDLLHLPTGALAGSVIRYMTTEWKQQACANSSGLHAGSHFTCDAQKEIKCLPGWTGSLCEVPICRKGCDPLQGHCRRPGECYCKFGFYGELCDKLCMMPVGQ